MKRYIWQNISPGMGWQADSIPPSSCPRLSRASTSFSLSAHKQDMDGRDKPGHDSGMAPCTSGRLDPDRLHVEVFLQMLQT
jgi:hypothetical protein